MAKANINTAITGCTRLSRVECHNLWKEVEAVEGKREGEGKRKRR